MPWVKFDDGYHLNLKVVVAGRDGRDVHRACIHYAASMLTDGFIADDILPAIQKMSGVPDLVAGLEACVNATCGKSGKGLLERVEGGYQVHDYLVYQPSRARVEATSQVRAAAGQLGGQQKASNLPADLYPVSRIPYPDPNPESDSQVGGEPGAETHPAPARETLPPAAIVSSEPTDATEGRPASPHAAADALIDAMVEGLRDAKKIGTLTTKTTAGLRRRERPTAQRLVRDGWSPPDIQSCARFLASIYATVDMLLVERQIDTWEVNGRPESKAAAMPARASPASPTVAPNGKLATILGGLAAYGEHVDDDRSVSAGDGRPLPDLATPGARSCHGQGAQRYLPPGAGRPDG